MQEKDQRRPAARRKKWRKRLPLLLLLGILLPVAVFCLAFRLYYREFYDQAVPVFQIPGLAENFVPQGVEACGNGDFLLSGYISVGGYSRLYYVKADGSARMIRVCNDDGSTLVSHSGGICTNGPYTYLAGGGGRCYILSSADLFDSTSHEARVLGTLYTDNAASFCYLDGDHLFVGEYEYGRFKTAASHHITTPGGDRNTAVMLSYPLDGDLLYGVATEPDAAYSIPPRVQGMCFTNDGRIVLSASSFRNSSRLYLYDLSEVYRRNGVYWLDERSAVPLYFLDTSSCVDVLPLPPYSEETVFVGNQLFILFESAANRFQFGKLVGGQFVYRMRLPEW